jgi:hypothetical protein
MSPAGTSLRQHHDNTPRSSHCVGADDPTQEIKKKREKKTQRSVRDVEHNIESEMREAQSAKNLETVGNGDMKEKHQRSWWKM